MTTKSNVNMLPPTAGAPAELHVYAGAKHGFGFRGIDESQPASTWIVRFQEFLGAQGMLKAPAPR